MESTRHAIVLIRSSEPPRRVRFFDSLEAAIEGLDEFISKEPDVGFCPAKDAEKASAEGAGEGYYQKISGELSVKGAHLVYVRGERRATLPDKAYEVQEARPDDPWPDDPA